MNYNSEFDYEHHVQNVGAARLITGYYGCSCHSFISWEECEYHHKKRVVLGMKVKHRCNGKEGVISRVDNDGFVMVKFGEQPCDNQLNHKANIIVL